MSVGPPGARRADHYQRPARLDPRAFPGCGAAADYRPWEGPRRATAAARARGPAEPQARPRRRSTSALKGVAAIDAISVTVRACPPGALGLAGDLGALEPA